MEKKLKEILFQEIQEKGPIPFSRYMEVCLYHPDMGYYQRQENITGPAGDFYTAPHVHSLFGQTLSRWVRNKALEMGLDEVTVLELGPGNGQLAQDILDHWDPKGPSLSMILVETGGPRKRDLEARFSGLPVRVLSPSEIGNLGPVEGIVLANEFFDALPLRIFQNSDGTITEIHVDRKGEDLEEVLLPPAQPSDNFQDLLEDLPEGFRTEVSPDWGPWMEKASRALDRGTLVIVDYGEFSDGLIVPWRAGGTLRCYRRHQVDSNPYEDPGEKDITAHVNFSFLKKLAIQEGFTLRSFTTQSSFLIKAGILDLLAHRMEQLPEKEATGLWLTVKNLIHEEGMGEIFKVMVLEKV
jgi:SAM-dependent MidA family methyltransferase